MITGSQPIQQKSYSTRDDKKCESYLTEDGTFASVRGLEDPHHLPPNQDQDEPMSPPSKKIQDEPRHHARRPVELHCSWPLLAGGMAIRK